MTMYYPLPDFPLQEASSLALLFKVRGISTFHEAMDYVHRLPYRRNSDRSNFRLVMTEDCGTCSTKHALLARLAHEHGVPVRLTVGIYPMIEENTPGVGSILQKYSLPFLPEAHCYLTWEDQRIDITRLASAQESIIYFFYKEYITPEQIGSYKENLHRIWMQQWLREFSFPYPQTLEELWDIREECIAAMGSGY